MRPFSGESGFLRKLPPFCWLRDTQVTWVLPALRQRSYPARTFIQRAGDKADGLYVLLSGTVRVLHEDGEGHELVAAAVGPNDFFGELGLLEGGECAASVRSQSPCEVLFIPREVILECLEDNAQAAMHMLRKVVARLCDAHRKMAGLALTNVYQRVAKVLMENSHHVDGVWRVTIGSEQIASLVGASREMVSRVVRDMVQRGAARRERRKLVVLDPNALAPAKKGPGSISTNGSRIDESHAQ